MKEISVFVDESGDFGEYDFRSPYYIISLVVHDQDKDISHEVSILEDGLYNLDFERSHCIHVGPIIRSENDYRFIPIDKRQKLLRLLMNFVRKTDIKVKCIYVEKKHIEGPVDMNAKLAKEISRFIKDNYEYFSSADVVKIYYDNGQVEISRILATVFHSLLENVEFRMVKPSEYRLFQVADLTCTIKLISLKLENNGMSKSEECFFEDKRTFKKNYYKVLKDKSNW